MNSEKIERAVNLLEQNLPIRSRQTELPVSLRRVHQSILAYYLENGKAPESGDLDFMQVSPAAIRNLARENIIILDTEDRITGAYPFTNEDRDFCVITKYGSVNAMCAFDALAISSMFNLPTRIESRCHLIRKPVVIKQFGNDISIVEPSGQVFAAINWSAAAGAGCCSTTLCSEMIFIAGEDNAVNWHREDSHNRELFSLDEAHAFISAVFVPLMQ